MKATEVRKITEQNQFSLTSAIKQIQECAKTGHNMSMFSNLHEDTFKRLIELGYKVSKFTNPFDGVEFIRVEW